jgi:hypothetical protein
MAGSINETSPSEVDMDITMKWRIFTLAVLLALAGCAATREKPVAAPAKESPAVLSGTLKAGQPIARIDRYTVVKGDTLSTIAAKPEVFGDPKRWPLLYQDNIDQIKPGGLIIPGQVLAVNRSHSAEEVAAILAKAQSGGRALSAAQPDQPKTATKVPLTGMDSLHAAQRAAESGDMGWAEYYYNTYLVDHVHDIDAWEALGSVYQTQNKLRDASRCFYNAANLLIDQGKTALAMRLMPQIQQGNPALADDIYWRLTAANQ